MHTPGPWTADCASKYVCTITVLDHKNRPITIAQTHNAATESQANACLIAAAPDLLAVCESILEATEGPALALFNLDNARHLLAAVVAKAKGE